MQDTAQLLNTYADGFGDWHAVVEGGTQSERFTVARDAIVGELSIRGQVTRDYTPRLKAMQVSDTRFDIVEIDRPGR